VTDFDLEKPVEEVPVDLPPRNRPPLSPLILGPLAREAGGFGSCGDVLRDRNDPDYRRLVEVHADLLKQVGRLLRVVAQGRCAVCRNPSWRRSTRSR